MTEIAGCHGIAVEPPEIGRELGWFEQPPPRGVRVEVVDAVAHAPDAELVWQLDEPSGLGLPPITTQTWQEPDGSTCVENTLNMSLRVDYGRSVVTVAPKDGNRQVLLEALASLALPLVAQQSGALVLHGSAVVTGDSAVLLCADGGSGKSSLLMGLVAAGSRAISEDQCVIDLDSSGAHRIWPGPSWVRLKQGTPPASLVAGTAPRFEALDKVAWDLGEWMAHGPARLERIVLLEPPGGDETVWEPVARDAAIARLAPHATWFNDQEAYARSVLPHIVGLAMAVPAFRLRIPRQRDWLPHGVAILTGA
jgi:hypothetical protein